jgi:anti-sigma regulatory factor (Ser/Thr protein kinase)
VSHLNTRSLHSESDGLTSADLPAGGELRRLALPGTPASIALGRDFTREALRDWHWTETGEQSGRLIADDVILVVSELLANASLHAGGPREIVLDTTKGLLRIEVVDGDAATLPVPRTPHDPIRPGGHGLYIVQQLSERWGTAPCDDGKTVWVEIGFPAP